MRGTETPLRGVECPRVTVASLASKVACAAVLAAGGPSQILATTAATTYPALNVAVVGATVVWLDNAGVAASGSIL